MTSVARYRAIGVRLVAQALDCVSVWLLEQDVRGRLRVTMWDREGGLAPGSRSIGEDVVTMFAVQPVLRPVIDGEGAILITVRAPEGGLRGWRLIGAVRYCAMDLEVAVRIVSVLADPAMVGRMGRRAQSTRSVLTAREMEILTLVGEGLTSAATARRCGISERTVQKHLEQAYRKLDCHDRLSAVLLARGTGLLACGASEHEA